MPTAEAIGTLMHAMRSLYITYAGAIPGRTARNMVAVSTQPLSILFANAAHNTYLGAKANLCIAPTWLQIDPFCTLINFQYSLKVVMANQYQVLEELGSKSYLPSIFSAARIKQLTLPIGGSFGVVYKAIEIATGEIVAIKHVSNWPELSFPQYFRADPHHR